MPKFWVRILSMSLCFCAIAACGGSGSDQNLVGASDLLETSNRGAVLSLACTGCHSDANGAIVSLDAYTANQIREALRLYVADVEGTTVMHRLARGYSSEDIDLMSTHLGRTETTR